MRTTLVRIEQEETNPIEADKIANATIKKLEDAGEKVTDIRIAVGRDADKDSGLKKRYSITYVLMHEHR